MEQREQYEINRLIGEFQELREAWQRDTNNFDWNALQSLAHSGAFAYNDGAGPSFHSLALDGVEHDEFHERFLDYSLQAGFDPFKLTHVGSVYAGSAELPVIDHDDLALAARWNPVSARMHSSLMALARTVFEPLAQQIRDNELQAHPELLPVAIACAESLPPDLLERISPELAPSQRSNADTQPVNPIEGYLTTAEVSVDRSSKPYG